MVRGQATIEKWVAYWIARKWTKCYLVYSSWIIYSTMLL